MVSPDVLDAGRRVDVELPAALTEQELDGRKVALVNGQAPSEFSPAGDFSNDLAGGRKCLNGRSPCKGLEVMPHLGLLATLTQALAIECQDLLLEARETHGGG